MILEFNNVNLAIIHVQIALQQLLFVHHAIQQEVSMVIMNVLA